MKLKFSLLVALSLIFTEDFTACGNEKVIEEFREVEEDAKVVADILEFAPTSELTVEMTGIKDKFRTEITIPSTIQVYGKEYKVTFNGDAFTESNVRNVKLTEGFTEIPDSMFYSCSSLPSIEIPSSVTSIGDAAFAGCESLTSIEIPSSVTSIGERAFAGCSGLTSIEVSTNNPNYTSINGVLFDKDIKTLISCPVGFSGKFSIPSSVTSIGEWAFAGCRELTSIEIPSSVTSIGDAAFFGCWGLTSIEIPSSVTSIGEWAFDNCYDTDIVIDNSEENVTVENGAFGYCKSVTWKR